MLALPACADWWQLVGLDSAIERNAELLRSAVSSLSNAWGTEPLIHASSEAADVPMALVRLPMPSRRAFSSTDGKAVQDLLHSQRIECPVKTINGQLYVRISAAVYNELHDYENLAQVVKFASTRWGEVLIDP